MEKNPCKLARQKHPRCIVCSQENPQGMRVQYMLSDNGRVSCDFDCNLTFQGYPDRVHGGIIASLIDGAMTHCLFFHGITAVTAELNVRYCLPVRTDLKATVRGWIEKNTSRLHLVKADIVQGDEVKVTATGKFMSLSDPVKRGKPLTPPVRPVGRAAR